MESVDNKILSRIRKMLAKAKDPASAENEVEICMKMAQKLMMEHNIQEGDIQIHPSDINKEVIFSQLWKSFKYKSTNFEWELLDTIANFYNCKIYHGINYDFDAPNWKDTKAVRLSIVGTEENRMVVKELYETVVEKFLTLSEIRYKEYQVKRKDELIAELKSMGLDTKGITVQYFQGIRQMTAKPTWITSYLAGTIKGIRTYLKSQQSELLQIESDKTTWGLIVKRHDELIALRLPELFKSKIKESNKLGNTVIYSEEAFREGIKDGQTDHNTKMIGDAGE